VTWRPLGVGGTFVDSLCHGSGVVSVRGRWSDFFGSPWIETSPKGTVVCEGVLFGGSSPALRRLFDPGVRRDDCVSKTLKAK